MPETLTQSQINKTESSRDTRLNFEKRDYKSVSEYLKQIFTVQFRSNNRMTSTVETRAENIADQQKIAEETDPSKKAEMEKKQGLKGLGKALFTGFKQLTNGNWAKGYAERLLNAKVGTIDIKAITSEPLGLDTPAAYSEMVEYITGGANRVNPYTVTDPKIISQNMKIFITRKSKESGVYKNMVKQLFGVGNLDEVLKDSTRFDKLCNAVVAEQISPVLDVASLATTMHKAQALETLKNIKDSIESGLVAGDVRGNGLPMLASMAVKVGIPPVGFLLGVATVASSKKAVEDFRNNPRNVKSVYDTFEGGIKEELNTVANIWDKYNQVDSAQKSVIAEELKSRFPKYYDILIKQGTNGENSSTAYAIAQWNKLSESDREITVKEISIANLLKEFNQRAENDKEIVAARKTTKGYTSYVLGRMAGYQVSKEQTAKGITDLSALFQAIQSKMKEVNRLKIESPANYNDQFAKQIQSLYSTAGRFTTSEVSGDVKSKLNFEGETGWRGFRNNLGLLNKEDAKVFFMTLGGAVISSELIGMGRSASSGFIEAGQTGNLGAITRNPVLAVEKMYSNEFGDISAGTIASNIAGRNLLPVNSDTIKQAYNAVSNLDYGVFGGNLHFNDMLREFGLVKTGVVNEMNIRLEDGKNARVMVGSLHNKELLRTAEVQGMSVYTVPGGDADFVIVSKNPNLKASDFQAVVSKLSYASHVLNTENIKSRQENGQVVFEGLNSTQINQNGKSYYSSNIGGEQIFEGVSGATDLVRNSSTGQNDLIMKTATGKGTFRAQVVGEKLVAGLQKVNVSDALNYVNKLDSSYALKGEEAVTYEERLDKQEQILQEMRSRRISERLSSQPDSGATPAVKTWSEPTSTRSVSNAVTEERQTPRFERSARVTENLNRNESSLRSRATQVNEQRVSQAQERRRVRVEQVEERQVRRVEPVKQETTERIQSKPRIITQEWGNPSSSQEIINPKPVNNLAANYRAPVKEFGQPVVETPKPKVRVPENLPPLVPKEAYLPKVNSQRVTNPAFNGIAENNTPIQERGKLGLVKSPNLVTNIPQVNLQRQIPNPNYRSSDSGWGQPVDSAQTNVAPIRESNPTVIKPTEKPLAVAIGLKDKPQILPNGNVKIGDQELTRKQVSETLTRLNNFDVSSRTEEQIDLNNRAKSILTEAQNLQAQQTQPVKPTVTQTIPSPISQNNFTQNTNYRPSDGGLNQPTNNVPKPAVTTNIERQPSAINTFNSAGQVVVPTESVANQDNFGSSSLNLDKQVVVPTNSTFNNTDVTNATMLGSQPNPNQVINPNAQVVVPTDSNPLTVNQSSGTNSPLVQNQSNNSRLEIHNKVESTTGAQFADKILTDKNIDNVFKTAGIQTISKGIQTQLEKQRVVPQRLVELAQNPTHFDQQTLENETVGGMKLAKWNELLQKSPELQAKLREATTTINPNGLQIEATDKTKFDVLGTVLGLASGKIGVSIDHEKSNSETVATGYNLQSTAQAKVDVSNFNLALKDAPRVGKTTLYTQSGLPVKIDVDEKGITRANYSINREGKEFANFEITNQETLQKLTTGQVTGQEAINLIAKDGVVVKFSSGSQINVTDPEKVKDLIGGNINLDPNYLNNKSVNTLEFDSKNTVIKPVIINGLDFNEVAGKNKGYVGETSTASGKLNNNQNIDVKYVNSNTLSLWLEALQNGNTEQQRALLSNVVAFRQNADYNLLSGNNANNPTIQTYASISRGLNQLPADIRDRVTNELNNGKLSQETINSARNSITRIDNTTIIDDATKLKQAEQFEQYKSEILRHPIPTEMQSRIDKLTPQEQAYLVEKVAGESVLNGKNQTKVSLVQGNADQLTQLTGNGDVTLEKKKLSGGEQVTIYNQNTDPNSINQQITDARQNAKEHATTKNTLLGIDIGGFDGVTASKLLKAIEDLTPSPVTFSEGKSVSRGQSNVLDFGGTLEASKISKPAVGLALFLDNDTITDMTNVMENGTPESHGVGLSLQEASQRAYLKLDQTKVVAVEQGKTVYKYTIPGRGTMTFDRQMTPEEFQEAVSYASVNAREIGEQVKTLSGLTPHAGIEILANQNIAGNSSSEIVSKMANEIGAAARPEAQKVVSGLFNALESTSVRKVSAATYNQVENSSSYELVNDSTQLGLNANNKIVIAGAFFKNGGDYTNQFGKGFYISKADKVRFLNGERVTLILKGCKGNIAFAQLPNIKVTGEGQASFSNNNENTRVEVTGESASSKFETERENISLSVKIPHPEVHRQEKPPEQQQPKKMTIDNGGASPESGVASQPVRVDTAVPNTSGGATGMTTPASQPVNVTIPNQPLAPTNFTPNTATTLTTPASMPNGVISPTPLGTGLGSVQTSIPSMPNTVTIPTGVTNVVPTTTVPLSNFNFLEGADQLPTIPLN